MSTYVQKRMAGVRVSVVGRPPVDLVLLLSPQGMLHSGPETILERLNATDRVIPFRRPEDDATLLISRSDIEWVLAGRGFSPELVCPPTYLVTREERVVASFRGGAQLSGLIRMELPPDFNRASDFLNLTDDWFPLVVEDGIVLVNKLQLVETRLFETSPLPITATGSGEARAT